MTPVALLLAMAAWLAAPAGAQCPVVFSVNPQSSTFSWGGAVVAPIQAPLTLAHSNVVVGLSGRLQAAVPGECPDTVDALVQQLGGASFDTTPELGPLELFPTGIKASANNLATVEWRDVSFNLTTAPLTAAAASGGGSDPQFQSDADAVIDQGYVLTTSLVSPTPQTVPLVGVAGSSPVQVFASVTEEGLARVELQGLNLTFQSIYYSTLNGQPLKGVSDYELNGTLVLEAAVGCADDCGPNGRCWPVAASSGGSSSGSSAGSSSDANGTALACACECGWAGAACDVPSGYCPRFAGEAGAAAVCPAVPEPAAPPSPSPAETPPPCTAVECTSQERFNTTTGRCECLPGWGGPTCESCRTNQACAELYDSKNATCSTSYAYTTHSHYKAYTCNMEGTGLSDAIENNSFNFNCNTTVPDVPSSPTGQYCQVHFALKNRGNNPITCRASQCSFRVNSTRVDCATTHCECEKRDECQDVQQILDSAEGKPVWVDCDPGTGVCTIEIQDFFVTFVAPCTPAECLVEGYTMMEGTYTVTTDKDYNAVIAAAPLMALVAVAACLSFYLFTHRAYWAAGCSWRQGAVPSTLGLSLSFEPLRESDPVHELRFEQLSCLVPVRRGWLATALPPAVGPWQTGAPVVDGAPAVGAADSVKNNHSSASNGVELRGAAVASKRPWWRRLGRFGGDGGSSSSSSSNASVDGEGGEGVREILSSVSGVAQKGELVGVLGPSGSGKTTLLGLVTGSTEDIGRGAILSGAVLLDGVPLRSEGRKKVAFVPQDDTLLSTLTVAECLTYSALLRLPATLTPKQIQTQVWRVLDELGLQHVASTRVGGAGEGSRGISGGERRRVTIGMELVTDPSILVLDEPLSGLDSYTAYHLVCTLKQVASAGRIVLLSVHQPSPAMFNMLDRAYLLAGGACVFCGPPTAAEAHFAAHGMPCPVGAAIAEHMLQVVSDPAQLVKLARSVHTNSGRLLEAGAGCSTAAGTGVARAGAPPTASVELLPSGDASPRKGSLAPGGGLGPDLLAPPVNGSTSTFGKELEEGGLSLSPSEDLAGAACSAAQQQGCGGLGPAGSGSGSGRLKDAAAAAGRSVRQRAAGCGQGSGRLSRELAVLYWRTLVDILRNPSLLLLHWVVAVGMGLLMGFIFYDVGLDISGAQNRAGGLFFALAFFAFTSLTTTDLLTAERRLVVREVRGGYYRPASYLLSKAVLDALLLRVIPVFLFSAPFYPLMGLQGGSSNVALFLMLLATFAVAVGALSLAVTVGCRTAGKASLIMNLILLISLLVGGFFVNVASIPVWIRWLHYISLFYYAYAGLIINEVATLSMDFVVEGYAAVSNVKGLVFLDIIGIDFTQLTNDIIILDCLYVGCLLLAFALLYARMPRPKRLRRRPPALVDMVVAKQVQEAGGA